MSNKIKKYTEEEWVALNNAVPPKQEYPELEGTVNLCNDIIELENNLAALNAWGNYQYNDIAMTADAFFEGWKQAIEWMKNKSNEKK